MMRTSQALTGNDVFCNANARAPLVDEARMSMWPDREIPDSEEPLRQQHALQ